MTDESYINELMEPLYTRIDELTNCVNDLAKSMLTLFEAMDSMKSALTTNSKGGKSYPEATPSIPKGGYTFYA